MRSETKSPEPGNGLEGRTFRFDQDTLAFANELVWEYRFDPSTRTMTPIRNERFSDYTHRCFVVVRSARQFFCHARFEPQQPAAEAATYRRLIREVVSRSPRQPSVEAEKITIPGYANLRLLSQAQEQLLKSECGGAWQSYVLRSHWRMVFPISRRHQERTAEQLALRLRTGIPPILHLVRFPQLTINHGIILFSARATEKFIQFSAYDPNIPDHPTEMTYDRPARTFFYPRNHYWAGGRVDVIEIYRGWIY
jgi:hypothetical protein